MLELRMILTMITWTFKLEALPDSLATFKAVDVNTHRAEAVNLKLAEVKY